MDSCTLAQGFDTASVQHTANDINCGGTGRWCYRQGGDNNAGGGDPKYSTPIGHGSKVYDILCGDGRSNLNGVQYPNSGLQVDNSRGEECYLIGLSALCYRDDDPRISEIDFEVNRYVSG